MPSSSPRRPVLFGGRGVPEIRRIAEILRTESVEHCQLRPPLPRSRDRRDS